MHQSEEVAAVVALVFLRAVVLENTGGSKTESHHGFICRTGYRTGYMAASHFFPVVTVAKVCLRLF